MRKFASIGLQQPILPATIARDRLSEPQTYVGTGVRNHDRLGKTSRPEDAQIDITDR